MGSERSYRLRSLTFSKRWARTSAGISCRTLGFSEAEQESDHKFTSDFYLGVYVRPVCHGTKRKHTGIQLNIVQLCSCTDHSWGCWKWVLHLKVVWEMGRWRTTGREWAENLTWPAGTLQFYTSRRCKRPACHYCQEVLLKRRNKGYFTIDTFLKHGNIVSK